MDRLPRRCEERAGHLPDGLGVERVEGRARQRVELRAGDAGEGGPDAVEGSGIGRELVHAEAREDERARRVAGELAADRDRDARRIGAGDDAGDRAQHGWVEGVLEPGERRVPPVRRKDVLREVVRSDAEEVDPPGQGTSIMIPVTIRSATGRPVPTRVSRARSRRDISSSTSATVATIGAITCGMTFAAAPARQIARSWVRRRSGSA
jgi:hypothetical protein